MVGASWWIGDAPLGGASGAPLRRRRRLRPQALPAATGGVEPMAAAGAGHAVRAHRPGDPGRHPPAASGGDHRDEPRQGDRRRVRRSWSWTATSATASSSRRSWPSRPRTSGAWSGASASTRRSTRTASCRVRRTRGWPGVQRARAGVLMQAQPQGRDAHVLAGLRAEDRLRRPGQGQAEGPAGVRSGRLLRDVLVVDESDALDPSGGHQLKFHAPDVGVVMVKPVGRPRPGDAGADRPPAASARRSWPRSTPRPSSRTAGLRRRAEGVRRHRRRPTSARPTQEPLSGPPALTFLAAPAPAHHAGARSPGLENEAAVDDRVAQLLDRQEIIDQMHAYARWVDLGRRRQAGARCSPRTAARTSPKARTTGW